MTVILSEEPTRSQPKSEEMHFKIRWSVLRQLEFVSYALLPGCPRKNSLPVESITRANIKKGRAISDPIFCLMQLTVRYNLLFRAAQVHPFEKSLPSSSFSLILFILETLYSSIEQACCSLPQQNIYCTNHTILLRFSLLSFY